MIENYFDYVNRIQTLIQHRACFPPADEEFKTSPNLVQKCREDGSICPFYGDTVVFQLPKSMKQYLSSIQKSLYQEHGKFLSEILPEESLHITLHDLSASTRKSEITPKIESHDNVIKSFLLSLKDKGTISQWNSQNSDGIRFALDSNMIDYQFFCSMKKYESIVS